MIIDVRPISIAEAIDVVEMKGWRMAIFSEQASLKANNTFELVSPAKTSKMLIST